MNETKFDGISGLYAQNRPGYPPALLDYLYGEGGLRPGCTVADIGAGTGLLTRLLLDRGSLVYAVEPGADMRREADAALAGRPGYTAVDAPAESTTLPDASVDGMVVAQAFHWFDRAAFRRECWRILRPGGPVALIWNSREAAAPVTRENQAINERFCPRFRGFSGGVDTENPAAFDTFFAPGTRQYRRFSNDLFYSEEAFVGRNLSSSYALRDGDSDYSAYVDALRALFHRHARDGALCLPNSTRCYWGRM